MTHDLDLTADIIDSRDIIARFEELEEELLANFNEQQELEDGEDAEVANEYDNALFREWLKVTTHDDADEFRQLIDILEDMRGCGGDEQWRGDWYPVTLIKDGRAFEDYMDELLEDCGDIPRDVPSYITISIDYDLLKTDYSCVEIDGEDYLYR